MRCGDQIFDDFYKPVAAKLVSAQGLWNHWTYLIKSQLLYRLSYALVTRRMVVPENRYQSFRRPALGAV